MVTQEWRNCPVAVFWKLKADEFLATSQYWANPLLIKTPAAAVQTEGVPG